MQTNSNASTSMLTFKDLRKAVNKLKKQEYAVFINVKDVDLLKDYIGAVDKHLYEYMGTLWGIRVLSDERLEDRQYKIIYNTGREEYGRF